MTGNDRREDCEVWPENWASVVFFLSIGTQWNISPEGKAIGLNYSAIESAMNMQNIRKIRRPSLLNDVRLMEETALNIFRERQ
jgi:hypothetical protein